MRRLKWQVVAGGRIEPCLDNEQEGEAVHRQWRHMVSAIANHGYTWCHMVSVIANNGYIWCHMVSHGYTWCRLLPILITPGLTWCRPLPILVTHGVTWLHMVSAIEYICDRLIRRAGWCDAPCDGIDGRAVRGAKRGTFRLVAWNSEVKRKSSCAHCSATWGVDPPSNLEAYLVRMMARLCAFSRPPVSSKSSSSTTASASFASCAV